MKKQKSWKIGSENFQLGLARAGKFQLEPITTNYLKASNTRNQVVMLWVFQKWKNQFVFCFLKNSQYSRYWEDSASLNRPSDLLHSLQKLHILKIEFSFLHFQHFDNIVSHSLRIMVSKNCKKLAKNSWKHCQKNLPSLPPETLNSSSSSESSSSSPSWSLPKN